MMDIAIYHNPACGTSRNTLALIRACGLEPRIINYLETPPARAALAHLRNLTGLRLRELVREKGTPFVALGLDDPALGDEALLDAIEAYPILLNRPIVVASGGAKLCRPSEVVLDLLPAGPGKDLAKEDGAPFLADCPIQLGPDVRNAFVAAGLPTDGLDEPGRRVFAYRTLGGTQVGFGGFERHGTDALLRSILVRPEARGRGIGRGLIHLLTRRAFEDGARTAYVQTDDAVPFFARQGFEPIDLSAAPPAILATRQAAGLCPASAQWLRRRIAL